MLHPTTDEDLGPDPPLVSVVMLNFNEEKYVDAAIRSILAQSYQNFELIVVDGVSTDHSKEIADAYSGLDQRIRVLLEPRRGISIARNTGLKESRGDFVTFTDADDISHENRLREQVRVLVEDSELAGCHTNGWIINESGEATGQTYHPDIVDVPIGTSQSDTFSALLRRDFILQGSMLLRRTDVPNDAYDVELKFAEDWDFWIRLAYRRSFAYIPRPLYGYRVHVHAPWKLSWIYHAMIYEKCLRLYNLSKEDRTVVIRKLMRLYRGTRSYGKLLGLLRTEPIARSLFYGYILGRPGGRLETA